MRPTAGATAPAADVDGPRCFMAKLRAVQWPSNFKISGVEPYDGYANPKQWLTSYATAVRAGGGNTSVMVNYLSVML